jgi:hypothetical protein
MPFMPADLQSVRRWNHVTAQMFHTDIVPRYEPAILSSLVSNWPAVQAAKQSDTHVCQYLAHMDNGFLVDAIMTAPQEKGRIFYKPDLSGFNFVRNQVPLSRVLEQTLRYGAFEQPPSVAAQSAPIQQCLPGFTEAHAMPLLPPTVAPRIWLGNRITTPAHIDESHNIACVVSGKRRFTLFPPAQISNLYLGPLDFTPTGSPISLVDFDQPDFDRFPRFVDALSHGWVADLEPGDALFIPTLWWHHVRSLSAVNVLVNYWWSASTSAHADAPAHSVFDALLHGVLAVHDLPPACRLAWAAIFAHYLADTEGQTTTHIPADRRGILTPQSPPNTAATRQWLSSRLAAAQGKVQITD